MEKAKNGLTGFILGDWLGTPRRGKGKGTFKPVWSKSYLRNGKCSGCTSMLLCALDSHCQPALYRQNLKAWYSQTKYVGGNIEFDVDDITQKAIVKDFRGFSSDANSGNRSLAACCVLALSPLSREEIREFVKATHNCRYCFQYNGFFVEFVRCLLACGDKETALQQAEQRCGLHINRQNFSNGSFVIDTVESAINWFMAGEDYETCVFAAVNAGKSSDMVGALTGFLAALCYGINATNGIKDFKDLEVYLDAFINEFCPSVS